MSEDNKAYVYPELTGRRRIYSDVDEITIDNIFEVLEKAMVVHMKNANEMTLLMRYEKGIQPLVREKIIRKEVNIKVSDNIANQITEFKLGYVWGQPITYVQRGNKDLRSSKGVQQWADLAEKALRLTNQYSVSNLNALLMQMQHESGGNPNAINLWDSNAKKGIPSKGLMQVIDPTFRSYAMSPYDSNIYDPLSNMVAAIRYTVSRYGSLYRGWTARGYKGYKNGGMPVNGEVYIANENGFGSEYIGRMGSNHVVANNQQIVQSVSSGVERANDETNALLRQIINYQERLLKKDSSVRIDSKKVNRQLSRGSRNSGYSFSTV